MDAHFPEDKLPASHAFQTKRGALQFRPLAQFHGRDESGIISGVSDFLDEGFDRENIWNMFDNC